MTEFSEYLAGKRALSKKQIFDIGFPYYEYENQFEEGEYIGILDMKEWGKTPIIHCFFTTEEGKKISLIAPMKGEKYIPGTSNIDFSNSNIICGLKFKLIVGKNSKGNTKWLNAESIKE